MTIDTSHIAVRRTRARRRPRISARQARWNSSERIIRWLGLGWAGLLLGVVLLGLLLAVAHEIGAPRQLLRPAGEGIMLVFWAATLSFPLIAAIIILAAFRKACLGPSPDRSWSVGQLYLTFAVGSGFFGILVMVLRAVETPPAWGLGKAFPGWLLPAAPAWCPLLYLLAAVGTLWGLRVASELRWSSRAGRLTSMVCGWLLVVGLFSLVQLLMLYAQEVVTRGHGWRVKPEAHAMAWMVVTLSLPGLLLEMWGRGSHESGPDATPR